MRLCLLCRYCAGANVNVYMAFPLPDTVGTVHIACTHRRVRRECVECSGGSPDLLCLLCHCAGGKSLAKAPFLTFGPGTASQCEAPNRSAGLVLPGTGPRLARSPGGFDGDDPPRPSGPTRDGRKRAHRAGNRWCPPGLQCGGREERGLLRENSLVTAGAEFCWSRYALDSSETIVNHDKTQRNRNE